ncbi:unnamed protein product [Mesocestoides corti]|uniref:Uncharacterized protein n=1 Tax=Mesocestoides corti TaxID=53468 RepID=A0A158QTL0_MESCO|nr:unnamed protein product [Mesocestoides corti]
MLAAWVSGDITSTQILCLQCLEGLRYNPAFPHLAACLYFVSYSQHGNIWFNASDVLDCLQDKCDAKALRISIPWRMLESFNGTSKSESLFHIPNTCNVFHTSPRNVVVNIPKVPSPRVVVTFLSAGTFPLLIALSPISSPFTAVRPCASFANLIWLDPHTACQGACLRSEWTLFASTLRRFLCRGEAAVKSRVPVCWPATHNAPRFTVWSSLGFFELANTSKDHPRSPSPPPPPPYLPKCNGQSEAASDADESPCLNGGECNGVLKKDEVTSCQDEYLASPAWYHPYDCLTPENYETLALFCLEMGHGFSVQHREVAPPLTLFPSECIHRQPSKHFRITEATSQGDTPALFASCPSPTEPITCFFPFLSNYSLSLSRRELGLAFAVKAHQESRSRESPDLIENCTTTTSSSSSPSPSQLPCLSLRLLRNLDPSLLPDFPSEDDDSDPTGDSSLSSNDIGAPFDVSFMGCNNDDEEEGEEAAASAPDWENGHTPLHEPSPSTTPTCESPCPGVRMRVYGSILKTPTSPDCERLYSEKVSPNGAINSTRVEKHVRFSLSASHPPPDLEAEYGGRSNSRRIQDMARRRGNYADHSYDSLNAAGAMDRFVGVFWPNLRRRSLAKRLLDLATFMVFLSVILAFSLLFLSLVICIPLAWLTSADSAAGACTVTDMALPLLLTPAAPPTCVPVPPTLQHAFNVLYQRMFKHSYVWSLLGGGASAGLKLSASGWSLALRSSSQSWHVIG